ncbi:uncharacterized protein [Aristolochia californica]|uniref:uncharacterized protein n=1 Tax=Aristolochia californica TaxID=171875 RepID=UPI0035DAAA4E
MSYLNTSGFGWDATTHQLTACYSVWQDYIKENKDDENYRQLGCPLYDKLALVVGNSIAMGTVSQTSVDMCNDIQHEEENSRLDMLEDVDLGRDTPSPFFTENESAPDQSQSVLRDTIKPEDDKVKEEKWIDTLTEILDMPIQWKFRAPKWLDTKIKRNIFTKMIVEERL